MRCNKFKLIKRIKYEQKVYSLKKVTKGMKERKFMAKQISKKTIRMY